MAIFDESTERNGFVVLTSSAVIGLKTNPYLQYRRAHP